jgi:hypothetical protein
MSINAAVRVQVVEVIEFSAFSMAFLAALVVRPDPSDPAPTTFGALVAGLTAEVVAVALLERRLPWQQRKSERRFERSLLASLGAGVATAAVLLLVELRLQPFVSEAPSMTPDAWLRNRLIGFGSIWLVSMAMLLVPRKPATQSHAPATALEDAPADVPQFVWPGGRGSR